MQQQVLTEHEFDRALPGWRVRVLLTITGDAAATPARVPLGLALVLDRSGSMGGDKMASARDAAAGLIQRLHPDDLVAVVTFDDEVETLSTPVTGAEQGTLLRDLMQVEARGSTNLSGGWLRGRELMAALPNLGGVRRVVLLTDGQANAGITDAGKLARLAAAAREVGVSTSAIGFGADYDEELLKAMADAGGGNVWHIERPDQASLVFGEELAGLQSLSAQNLTVELRPGPDVATMTVLHDYRAVTLPDGHRVELGDLYAREPRKLLAEFVVPAHANAPRPDLVIAQVQVSAHVVLADGGIELRVVTFPVALSLEAQGAMHPEVRREVVLLAAAKARDEAVAQARRGDSDGAAGVLREASHMLRESGLDDAFVREQAADLDATARRVQRERGDEADLKYLKQKSYNSRRGKLSYDAAFSRAPEPDEPPPPATPKPPRKPRPPKA